MKIHNNCSILTKLCEMPVRVHQHIDFGLDYNPSIHAIRKTWHLLDNHLDSYGFVQIVLHIFLYSNHLLHHQKLAILFVVPRELAGPLNNNQYLTNSNFHYTRNESSGSYAVEYTQDTQDTYDDFRVTPI